MSRMFLSLEEIEIRTKFDAVRAKYISKYGDFIFKKCLSCRGTGLYIDQYTSGGPVWDCSSYCHECGGYGGEFDLGILIFECNECKGANRYERSHCKKCNGSGFVDWIENLINDSNGFRNHQDKLFEGYVR